MRKQQLFLAYYTFFISIALFLWALFFSPKPEGFLLTVLFIPTSLYFFLSFTGHSKMQPHTSEDTEKQYMIPIVILLTLFISAFSIFVFSAIRNPSNSDTTAMQTVSKQLSSLQEQTKKQNNASAMEMTKELLKIKKQLSGLEAAEKTSDDSSVMGEKTTVGTVTLKDAAAPASIYAEKNLTSKIVGTVTFDKNYTYIEKDGDWYLILLTDAQNQQTTSKEGYIQSQLVKEVAY